MHSVEQLRATFLQLAAMAVTLREIQLIPKPPLAKERRPVFRPRVQLRRAADGVVPLPSEAVRRLSVLMRELASQCRLRAAGTCAEIEPFECEPCVARSSAHGERARNPYGVGRSELAKSLRFGLQHRKLRGRGKFHEQRAGRA